MNPVGKIIKVLLAIIVSAAIVFGLQGCKKDSPAPAPSPSPSQPPTLGNQAPSGGESGGMNERVVELKVTDNGYEPDPITLKKGEPVVLKVTRLTDQTCATEFVLDEHDINQKLPLNETVTIRFTPEQTGELKYGCGMDKMISGRFTIQ